MGKIVQSSEATSILTPNIQQREELRSQLIKLFDEDFISLRASVLRLENGPPVGFPVQFRVSGHEHDQIRKISYQVADIMRNNQNLSNVQLDWDEPTKVIRINIHQSKARLLEISSNDIANIVNGALQGLYATEFREGVERIDVIIRGAENERKYISYLENLMIPNPTGQSVPLSQIASLAYDFEEGVILRRNRVPTITVRANVYGKIQAPTVSNQIEKQLIDLKRNLPMGYWIETGGAAEESIKGSQSIAAGMPLLIFSVLTAY